MPLIKSGSKEAVSTNIREMMASGYPQKQAVAASLNNARRYGRKYADGGALESPLGPHVDYSEGAPVFQNWPAKPPAELRRIPDDWIELRPGQQLGSELVEPYRLSPRDLKQVLRPEEWEQLRGMGISPPPARTRMGPRATGGRAYMRGGFASGGTGSVMPWTERASARGLQHAGFIKSPVPGRTDQLPIGVGGGAYVLPADHVAHVGQGNSIAGGNILDSMFKLGTYGMNRGIKPRMPRLGMRRKQFAEGGTPGKTTDIVAAGGEYVIPPEVVTELGGGDINHGHKILDKWVMDTRKHHIKTLRGLKPPKKS